MTDSDIIKGIRENSPLAWRAAYTQMKPGIRTQVAPLLTEVKDMTFDDVFEEGLIILMENIKDGKINENGENNLSGYLYTICRRIALKLRSRKTPQADDGGEVKMSSSGGGFTIVRQGREIDQIISPDVLSEEERYARDFLDRVLAGMSESCRKIFKRFYWDKMPMDMIAPLMGLKNANSAKTTKNRCMDKFKELARKMLADDEKAEKAVQRTVERNAVRDLLEQFRKEDEGELSMAACRNESAPADSGEDS